MNYTEFEKVPGKQLSVVEKIIGSSFRKISQGYSSRSNSEYVVYSNDEYHNDNFFGMSSNHLTLVTNEKETVESISIHFRKVIDRSFYDAFVKEYGEPDHIHVIYKRTVISEGKYVSDDGDFVSNVSKNEVDVREGTFDEKPLFIIWKKENFEIKAFLRHEQNISEITFSVNN